MSKDCIIGDVVSGGAGGGEINTASNLGAGEGLFAQKIGFDLQFKSLIAGTGIAFNVTPTDITIDASALDQLVRVSATDTTSGFLQDKFSPGTGYDTRVLNPAANESLELYKNEDVFVILNNVYNVTEADRNRVLVAAPDFIGGNITINMPSIAAVGEGFNVKVWMKTLSSTAFTVTVNANGTDLLDSYFFTLNSIVYEKSTTLNMVGWDAVNAVGAPNNFWLNTDEFNDNVIKVSEDDFSKDYLENKLIAGSGFDTRVLNPGANESLEFIGNEDFTVIAGPVYNITELDRNKTLVPIPLFANITINFPLIDTIGEGFKVKLWMQQVGAAGFGVTLQPSGADTFDKPGVTSKSFTSINQGSLELAAFDATASGSANDYWVTLNDSSPIQELATAPPITFPGAQYYDTTLNLLRFYNGTRWLDRSLNVINTNADYNEVLWDDFILADSSGGPININLLPANIAKREIKIKRNPIAGVNTVFINLAGGDVYNDGVAGPLILVGNQSAAFRLISNGVQWFTN